MRTTSPRPLPRVTIVPEGRGEGGEGREGRTEGWREVDGNGDSSKLF